MTEKKEPPKKRGPKAKPKTKNEKVTAMDPVKVNGEQVLLFKAKKALGPSELKALSNAIKHEQAASGCKIVLVPHSVEEVEVGNE